MICDFKFLICVISVPFFQVNCIAHFCFSEVTPEEFFRSFELSQQKLIIFNQSMMMKKYFTLLFLMSVCFTSVHAQWLIDKKYYSAEQGFGREIFKMPDGGFLLESNIETP